MLTYDEAISIVLQTVQPLAGVETPLSTAVGRVLAQPVQARWDLPPADNSAMDGFAFRFDGQLAGTRLPLIGSAFAGHPFPGAVPMGSAVRITTGAPLPVDTDTVVPQEETEVDAGMVTLSGEVRRGQHVRLRGEEFRSGELLLAPGTLLTAGEIGLLASAGIARLRVVPKPRVAILSTGDELVELGETPGPGQIVNSNMHLLAARLVEVGCEPLPLGIGRDRPEELEEMLRSGLQADMLLSTGGVSVGEKDHVRATLERHGFRLGFWQVAIKPGKPVLFGMIGTTPVFGLPGNPAAAAATFELFVLPALRRLAGRSEPRSPRLRATLETAVRGAGKRQAFLWCRLREENGRYFVAPSQRQGSGQNRSLNGACALLPVPVGNAEVPAGSEVEVLLLRLPQGRS